MAHYCLCSSLRPQTQNRSAVDRFWDSEWKCSRPILWSLFTCRLIWQYHDSLLITNVQIYNTLSSKFWQFHFVISLFIKSTVSPVLLNNLEFMAYVMKITKVHMNLFIVYHPYFNGPICANSTPIAMEINQHCRLARKVRYSTISNLYRRA